MPKHKHTAEEMRDTAARILGYEKAQTAKIKPLMYVRESAHVDKDTGIRLFEEVIPVRDFTPSTRIDQAMEVLDEWNTKNPHYFISFSNRWEKDGGNYLLNYNHPTAGYTFVYINTLSDCANQIMLTIMEMRGV